MSSRLRGHHLICLNFFKGEGYSKEYIDNIYSILKKETIEIVNGIDEVCNICPYMKYNKCASSEYTDEKIHFQDYEALKLLDFKVGDKVNWKLISEKLPEILEKWKSKFCFECSYKKVCFNETVSKTFSHKFNISYRYI